VVAGLILGLFVSTGYPIAVVAAAGLPHLVRWRRSAALGFYLGALWPIWPAAANFFGGSLNPSLLWIAASLLHTLPFAILPPYWATLVASFGYASPLMAAGLLFPALGWIGIAFTSGLASRAWPILCAVAVAANLTYRPASPPTNWIAVDTHFGPMGSPLDEYRTAVEIQRIARQSKAKVIVFPESVVPSWNEGTVIFWEESIETLRAEGKTLLFGAKIHGEPYTNALVAVGADSHAIPQAIPVPLAMSDAKFDPFADSSGILHGHRVFVVICHEQLLLWSMLRALAAQPDIFIGASNDHWVADTPIPRWRSTAFFSTARLAGIPHISATNRPARGVP
jgi:hypothetical protein